VAAENKLKEGITNLNSTLANDEMIDRGIDWKFSPPTGSHFGGPYERLVAFSRNLGGYIVQNNIQERPMKFFSPL